MKINNPQDIIQHQLLPIIKECFNDNLKSVILYGSAASERFDPLTSDINILILLNKNITKDFIGFGRKAKSVIRKYRISILTLTTDDFISSADVFPIEYYDIKDRHLDIYGENIEGKLTLSVQNLRHQLEERLRGFSNQLRQAIIESGGNKVILEENIKAVPGMIKTLMRAVLRLEGINVKDLSEDDIYKKIEESYGVDMSVFTVAPHTLKYQDIDSVIEAILETIGKITSRIDSMAGKE